MSSTQVDVIDRQGTITELKRKVDIMISNGQTNITLTNLKTWLTTEINSLPPAQPQIKRLFFVSHRRV